MENDNLKKFQLQKSKAIYLWVFIFHRNKLMNPKKESTPLKAARNNKQTIVTIFKNENFQTYS